MVNSNNSFTRHPPDDALWIQVGGHMHLLVYRHHLPRPSKTILNRALATICSQPRSLRPGLSQVSSAPEPGSLTLVSLGSEPSFPGLSSDRCAKPGTRVSSMRQGGTESDSSNPGLSVMESVPYSRLRFIALHIRTPEDCASYLGSELKLSFT